MLELNLVSWHTILLSFQKRQTYIWRFGKYYSKEIEKDWDFKMAIDSTTLITCRGLGWGLWLCGFVVALSKVHLLVIVLCESASLQDSYSFFIFWSLCYVSLVQLIIFITIMGVMLISSMDVILL